MKNSRLLTTLTLLISVYWGYAQLSDCTFPGQISVNAQEVCGQGAIEFSIDSAHQRYLWFDQANDQTIMAYGKTFTTPNLSQSNTYWVREYQVGENTQTLSNLGKITQEQVDEGSAPIALGKGVRLDVNETFMLNSVDIFVSSQAEDITVQLVNMTTSEVVATKTLPTANGSRFSPKKVTLNLDFTITPGSYKLIAVAGPKMLMDYEASFPYTLSYVGTITKGVLGNNNASGSYYYFYDFKITVPELTCISEPVAAQAIVNEIKPVWASADLVDICAGVEVTISALSENLNYEYQWQPGNFSGSTAVVSPTESTLYTVTATDSLTGCQTTATVYVAVSTFPQELPVMAEHVAELGVNEIKELVYEEHQPDLYFNFNDETHGWAIQKDVNNPSVYWNRVSGVSFGIRSNDNSGFFIANAALDTTDSNFTTSLISPIFSLSDQEDVALNFYQFYNQYWTTPNAFIEISTDGGRTYQELKSYNTKQGDSYRFMNEVISLVDYKGQSNLRIRFRLTGVDANYWAIDNVKIIGAKLYNYTWTPMDNLYLDAQATQPYHGEAISKVYFRSPIAGTYNYGINIISATHSSGVKRSHDFLVTS